MNFRVISGWLHDEPCDAVSPDGVRKLLLTVMLRDDLGHEFPERVMIEEPGLMARVRERLTRGSAVICQGTVRAWPLRAQSGRDIGHDRWIVASDVEITRQAKAREVVK